MNKTEAAELQSRIVKAHDQMRQLLRDNMAYMDRISSEKVHYYNGLSYDLGLAFASSLLSNLPTDPEEAQMAIVSACINAFRGGWEAKRQGLGLTKW
jgi:hypothetical protein